MLTRPATGEDEEASMKDIDFAALSLQDALDLGILIEEEAAERYEEFADQMDEHHTSGAAEFFRLMVSYEKKHRDDLAERRHRLFREAERRVDLSSLWDVEAPEYDKVRAFMTPRQALLVALESEQKAHRFFVDAIPHISDARARALFEEFRDEEISHQDLIRKEIARLPEDPEIDIDDYVDEPVAQ
jgi:erythrin-vacuolar iron transport family protein